MRELSLHILDLVENSIRAEATIIAVSVVADPTDDLLRIVVEDNGTGLKAPPAAVLDPFYTTKSGKRTGLGLSLFRAAAESTGGRLTLGKSDLGGVKVSVEMGLTHVDRNPLGDLATTLGSVVCTNPDVDFRFRLGVTEQESSVSAFDAGEEMGAGRRGGLAVAQHVIERIRAALAAAEVLS